MSDIADRLRHHVQSRNGLARDDDGNISIPNGAWAMMLEAADEIDRLCAALRPFAERAKDMTQLAAELAVPDEQSVVRTLRQYHAALKALT